MIDQDIKTSIIQMFLGGAETGQVLGVFPSIGKTTIYGLRKEAAKLGKKSTVPEERPIGVIGDTHLPFAHPRYLEFCQDVFEEAGATEIVHIGDLFDNHAMSYHESDPDGDAAGREFQLAMSMANDWYEAFPEAYWILGNHDNLPLRRIKSAGLPKGILRERLYGNPDSWKVRNFVVLRDVRFSHGIGSAGIMGHLNLSKAKGMSVVMGHCHSFGGVAYRANENDLFFGMNVGCGIDIEAYGMEYSKDFINRPTLGCGLVYNSHHAVFVPMDLVKYSRNS
jgi:predicted phosphodiesterase